MIPGNWYLNKTYHYFMKSSFKSPSNQAKPKLITREIKTHHEMAVLSTY